jgi:leucine-zipper of insertion element IS481
MNPQPKSTAEVLKLLPAAVRENLHLKLLCVQRVNEAPHGQSNATARELSIAHGCSIQCIQRWVTTYKRHGVEGLIDRRLDNKS